MRSRTHPLNVLFSRSGRLVDPVTMVRLIRARDYLAAQFDKRTSLADSASVAALSPFHFTRMFTSVFGETPHEFVTRIRIEEAKKRLVAGNQSVTGICLDVGYESLGSFSLRFRSLTGLSPADFRREARRIYPVPAQWPLLYIPACYQHFFLGRPPQPLETARIEK
jgi:AraC-like DNA-binding protein